MTTHEWYTKLHAADIANGWQVQQSEDGEKWQDADKQYYRAFGNYKDCYQIMAHFRRYNLAGLQYRLLNIETGEVR